MITCRLYFLALATVICLLFSGPLLAQPVAGFSASPTTGCIPLTVNFTNSSANAVSYKWVFGNGNGSNLKDPGAIYSTPGVYDVTLIVTDASGKVDSVTKKNYITVNASPRADFSLNVQGGCAPAKISFTDKSAKGSSNITSWLWDFGDGGSSTSQSPSYTYTKAGKYDVILLVSDGNGCDDQIVKKGSVTINNAPVFSFKANDSVSCTVPLKVNFTSKVTGTSSYAYEWEFGDGGRSTSANPQYTYANGGTYTVKLKVTDAVGCTATGQISNYIKIGKEAPKIVASNTSGCPPLNVAFQGSTTPSSSSATKYEWDFGDGTTSNARSPIKKYTLTGQYTVKLVVTSGAGCKDSVIETNLVKVLDAPKANFSVDKTFTCDRGTQFNFTNASQNANSYEWDFGDSTAVSKDANPRHVYADTGTYIITLKAIGSNKCEALFSRSVRVAYPYAGFKPDNDKGCIGMKVVFLDTSRSEDPIIKWEWDFGDGTTSTLQHPDHVFGTEGKFQVKLKVTTQRGCTATKSLLITTDKKPKAAFQASPLVVCPDSQVVVFANFSDTFSIKPTNYFWNFGDKKSSELKDPIHIYNSPPGKYTVTLVASRNGCNDTLIMKDLIEVLAPFADIEATTSPCRPDSVQFESKSIGADSLTWDFGDKTARVYGQINPIHVYARPGAYYVTLRADNFTTGCHHTTIFEVKVGKVLDVLPKIGNTIGCLPFSVSFMATVTDEIDKWLWDFGDGGTSDLKDVIHEYVKPGIYSVKLKAINKNGCEKTFEWPDLVRTSGPSSSFFVTPTSGCVPLNIKLVSPSYKQPFLKKIYYDMGNGDVVPVTADTVYYTYNTVPSNQTLGYKIVQMLEDSNGCTANNTARVYPTRPIADFYYSMANNCDFVDVQFVSILSSAGQSPFKYFWDFGDGTTSVSDASPKKTFTKPGAYTITFVIEDKNGCRDTTRQSLSIIFGKPVAAFSSNIKQASCPPLLVDFTDMSTAGGRPITSWEWEFGDNTYSSLRNPKKIYLTPGSFTVKLRVTDDLGCTHQYVGVDAIVVKGPVGTYSFDKKKGCIPLKVNFTGNSPNATLFEWDLGDGNVIRGGKTVNHEYTTPGTYIPVLILHDSFGCFYPLPRIDTIVVSPGPIANFEYNSICSGEPTSFTDLSAPLAGTIVKWQWYFGDGKSSKEQHPVHVFKKPGLYKTSLTIYTSNNCEVTKIMDVLIRGGDAEFRSSVPTGCIGDAIYFTDKSYADTSLVEWRWDFGDGSASNLQNPSHTYLKKGYYDISLWIRTLTGCKDSVTHDKFLVGDTIAPPPPYVYRATVEGDATVKLEFSRYKDIDLANYNIYRRTGDNGPFALVATVTGIDDTVYLDMNVNTLRSSYCYYVTAQNICGYVSAASRTHCTVELTASPGLNTALLNWNPYKGWNNVKQYDLYRENIRQKGQYEYIATVPGTDTAFVDSNIICYQSHSYQVKATEEAGFNQVSYSDTAATTPVYIPNVPPTEVVTATVVDNKDVRIDWLDLPKVNVRNYVLQRSADGQKYEMLHTTFDRTITSYRDTKAEVQQRSYYYRMQVIDSCGDASPYSNLGKTILLKVDTTEELRPILKWTKYREWAEGVKYYDIEIKDKDGNFNLVTRTADANDTVFVDNVTDLNSLPHYCYRIVGHRNGAQAEVTSASNEDCAEGILIVHIPNAFSPNNDRLNDSFFVKGMYIKEFNIKIYDRWGTRVYESHDLKGGWSGRFKEAEPLMDSYRYLVRVKGVNNDIRHLSGWVTIIK